MSILTLRTSIAVRTWMAGMLLVALTVGMAGDASAQCATCPTATVAYSPVVAQPTVAYKPYTGWYPGKLIDQWRLRRAGVGTAPTYTAAYSPTYSAAYAPSYTAAYAPTYTTAYAPAYRPYVTSYAPLSGRVVSARVSSGCNTCAQTAYYPVMQTVARPVLMRPVLAAPACNTCNTVSYAQSACGCDAGCGGCSACSSGVSQAVYGEAPACSSCAGNAPVNVVPPASSSQNVGPQTGQPSYAPVPEPADSRYNSQRPIESDQPADEVDPLNKFDPGPAATEGESSTWYNAPKLLDPRDRTAARTYKSRKPTVDIWTAVYRGKASNHNVSSSQTAARPARTQAEIDADGWSSAPSNR